MMMVFTIIIVLLVLMGYLFIIVVRVGSDGDKSRGAFSIIVNVWLWFMSAQCVGRGRDRIPFRAQTDLLGKVRSVMRTYIFHHQKPTPEENSAPLKMLATGGIKILMLVY